MYGSGFGCDDLSQVVEVNGRAMIAMITNLDEDDKVMRSKVVGCVIEF